MKTLKFALFLLIGMSIFSCSNQEATPNAVQSQAVDQPLFQQEEDSGEELIEIGHIIDDVFEFTVSEDELAQVYASNIELNFGESGTMEDADVLPSTSEDESGYYVVLAGTLGEEGSASLSAEVITEEDPDGGSLVVKVRLNPVYPGICHANWCGKCRQSDLAQGNRFCKCIWGPWGSPCPIVDDPTIIWTQ